MTRHDGKVFGIGLRKTGTRSLAAATRELGYRTMHKGGGSTSRLVDRAVDEGRPLLTHLGAHFDVYLDVESLVRNFRLLDQQYPGSKFILTTRDIESWLASMERHVLGNRERAARGEYDGTFLEVEPERWREDFVDHHAAVRDHFAGRPDDLLELDVAAGHGWERLAPFLGCKIPSRPFPWENRQGAGTYRAQALAGRVRTTARAVRHRVLRSRWVRRPARRT